MRGREPPVADGEQVLVGEVVEEPPRLIEASRQVVEESPEARDGCALGGGAVPPRPEPLEQSRCAPFARRRISIQELASSKKATCSKEWGSKSAPRPSFTTRNTLRLNSAVTPSLSL